MISKSGVALSSILLVSVCQSVTARPSPSRFFVTNNLTNNSPGGRLLEFDGTTGQFSSLVSNINTPRGITLGPDGSLYVASINGDSILKFSISNGLQQTIFVPSGSGGLNAPWGLTFGPGGNLFVTSGNESGTVLRYNGSTGAFMNVFGSDPQVSRPATDLRFGPNGNLFVATLTQGVFQFNGQTGQSLGNFIPPTHFRFAQSITFGPDANLYIATEEGNSVLRYDGTTGAFIDTFVAPGSGGVDHANAVRFGPDGNLYVAGGFNDAILRYDGRTGAFIDVFASHSIDAPMSFVFVVPEPDCCLLLAVAAVSIFSSGRQTEKL